MASAVSSCFCHVLEIAQEPILPCTEVSWAKLYDCAGTWVSLDGLEQQVSVKILQNNDRIVPDRAGFHRRCYQRFTDVKRIRQGVSRKEKGRLHPQEKRLDDSEVSDFGIFRFTKVRIMRMYQIYIMICIVQFSIIFQISLLEA